MRLRLCLAMVPLLGGMLAVVACFDDNVPSSFHNPASEAGAGDGGGSDAPNLVGDAAPGSFQCGMTVCNAGSYCVRSLDDAGVTESSHCYPLLQCNDCPCVTNVVATTVCAGESLACAGAPGGHLYVLCSPAAPAAADAGDGG